jgi:quinol monooxygenase YgiN
VTRPINIFIEFELIGELERFEAIFREILALAQASGAEQSYDFYREPAQPARIFAIESHANAEALGAHFERSFPLLQQAWACARPVQTFILGDVPAGLKAQIEQGGATVVPAWISNR